MLIQNGAYFDQVLGAVSKRCRHPSAVLVSGSWPGSRLLARGCRALGLCVLKPAISNYRRLDTDNICTMYIAIVCYSYDALYNALLQMILCICMYAHVCVDMVIHGQKNIAVLEWFGSLKRQPRGEEGLRAHWQISGHYEHCSPGYAGSVQTSWHNGSLAVDTIEPLMCLSCCFEML